MRIAYYNPLVNEPWGCGIHGRGLVAGWRALGHDVLVLPAIAGADGEPTSKIGRFSRVPELLKVPARDARARLRVLKEGSVVLSAIQSFSPDVVVLRRHGYDYVADLLVRRLMTRTVAELNAIAFLEAAAHWGEWALPWERRREWDYIAGCDRVVCVTADVAEQVRQAGIVPKELIVASNGVDAVSFSPDAVRDASTGAWSDSFSAVVGYCGKGGGLHDLATMSRAMMTVAERLPDTGFLFVGPTAEEMENAGIDIADSRVRITGRVSHSQIPSHLVCSQVLWAAFNNIYGSPLKLYEYMAMGVPFALAMEGAAVHDAVSSGGGVVVPRHDDDALADAVVGLLDARADADALGRSGREWVMREASWSAVAERMIEGA